MRKLTLVAVFLLLLVGSQVGVLSASALSSVPVSWSVVPNSLQVSQGSPVKFEVLGPARANFTLEVTAPPWNFSAPIFEKSALTSNATSLSAVGYANVSMDTGQFAAQTYQATVLYGGNPVAYQRFALIAGVNETSLNATVNDIKQQMVIDEHLLSYLRAELASVAYWQQVQWWSFLILTIAFSSVVLFAELRKDGRSLSHRLWIWLRGFFITSAPPSYKMRGSGLPPVYVSHPLPDQLFRADFCDACRRPQGEGDLRDHILTMHPSVYGPGGPIRGRHYRLSVQAVRDIMAARKDVDRKGSKAAKSAQRPRVRSMKEILG